MVLAEAEHPPLSGPVRATIVDVVPVGAAVVVVEPDGAAVVVVEPDGAAVVVVEPDGAAVVVVEPDGAAVVVVEPDGAAVVVVEPDGAAVVELEDDPLEVEVVDVLDEPDGIENPTEAPVSDIACCNGPGSEPVAAANPVPVTNIAEAPAISVFVLIALPNIIKYPFRRTRNNELSAHPTSNHR